MNQILHCDWLPRHLVRSGWLDVSCKKLLLLVPFNKFVIDQDGWIFAPFFFSCVWISTTFCSINKQTRITSSDRHLTLYHSGTLWKVYVAHAQPPSSKVGPGAVDRLNVVLSFVKFNFFIAVRGCWLASKERGHQWRQQLKFIMPYPFPRYSMTKVAQGTRNRPSRNSVDLNLRCTSVELPGTWHISDLSGLTYDQSFAE